MAANTIILGDSVVSDRAAFREALKGTAYEVIADAANGDALMVAIAAKKPWCVAFDLLLPGHADKPGDGGVKVMKRIRDKFPDIRFLVIHNVQTAQLVMGALSEGAGARVRKPFKREALLEALAKVGTGQEGTTSVKQAAVRLKKQVPISYKLVTDGFFTKKRDAMTSDVSEGGIGMTTEEKLARGVVLNIELSMVGEAPLKAKMQVMRAEPAVGMPRYEIGMTFVELAQPERERLKRFIMAQLEKGTVAPQKR